jgi:hypothetical protein
MNGFEEFTEAIYRKFELFLLLEIPQPNSVRQNYDNKINSDGLGIHVVFLYKS